MAASSRAGRSVASLSSLSAFGGRWGLNAKIVSHDFAISASFFFFAREGLASLARGSAPAEPC